MTICALVHFRWLNGCIFPLNQLYFIPEVFLTVNYDKICALVHYRWVNGDMFLLNQLCFIPRGFHSSKLLYHKLAHWYSYMTYWAHFFPKSALFHCLRFSLQFTTTNLRIQCGLVVFFPWGHGSTMSVMLYFKLICITIDPTKDS